ncbi:hypothetical protein ERJ75_000827800 [Trypanosoma vivax]|uniref:WD repeat-containing protein 54 beta-propeller domain-containing protein n=1 Tax=Trypanosoma vivax (strain Y486) TaxID=1055687 RepID=G0TZ59_TRYVY|nr:hypothetical protein TRVL_03328 [Trypanosoma vivax]KAH8613050.1 hypothetical protein ERJ75_000827800 [Trypanosoma vivax]CCC49262.1 conserved hypothetical protein [Trypanosoma vivax Y486]
MPPTLGQAKVHKVSGIRAPASLQYNNLSYVEKYEAAVYASRTECVVAWLNKSKTTLLPLEYDAREPILQCSAIAAPPDLLHCNPPLLILLTMRTCTQLWTTVSPLGSIVHREADGRGCCGVLSVGTSKTVDAVVGTSNGSLLFAQYVLEVSSPSKPAEGLGMGSNAVEPFRVIHSMNGHKGQPITAVQMLSSVQPALRAASGDVSGKLVLWNREYKPYLSISTSECVTGIQIVSDGAFVAVANGAGKLMLVDTHTGETRISVCAHSRWINALSFNSTVNALISVSEDGYVSLWSTPGKEGGAGNGSMTSAEFNSIATHHLGNVLPTGAALSADGKRVFITAYDTNGVIEYNVEEHK